MRWFGLAIVLAVLALDQLSKDWLIALMAANPRGITVTSFFDLVQVWNYGVSFGLFNDGDPNGRWVLIALSLAIVAFLAGWLWRSDRWLIVGALGLVIGGALGNVVDRFRYGAVADFFYFHIDRYYWPAFNVADAGVVCGVGLLLLDALLAPKETG